MAAPIAMSARLATRRMLVRRTPLHLGAGREARTAHAREPTAADASAETVAAVPKAMANVPMRPAQKRPWLRAKTSNSKAPVQGRMPTDKASSQADRQDQAPATLAG
jgi:hypothetical protein